MEFAEKLNRREFNPKDLSILYTRSTSKEPVTLSESEQIVRAVNNPVRGRLEKFWEETDGESRSSRPHFRNFVAVKAEFINAFGRRLLDAERPDHFGCTALWEMATSTEPGLDINLHSVKMLSRIKLSDAFISNLKRIAITDQTKSGSFAAHILNSHGIETDTYSQVGDVLHAFSDLRIKSIFKGYATSDTAIANFAYLGLYETITGQIKNNGKIKDALSPNSPEFKAVVAQIEEAVIQQDNYQEGVSIGIEIQGDLSKRIPNIHEDERFIYTSISPADYRHAHDITLGGLRSSETDREPAAVQIMLVAAGHGCDPIEYIQKNLHKSWNLCANKRAIRNRSSSEDTLLLFNTDPRLSEFASELRLLSIGKSNAATIFEDTKFLGDLAYEHQKGRDGEEHKVHDAQTWKVLVEQMNGIFKKYGLPSVESIWAEDDLMKLGRIQKGNHGQSFLEDAQTALAQARIRHASDAENELKSVFDATKSKSSEVVEKTLQLYIDRLHEFDSTVADMLNVYEPDRITSIRQFSAALTAIMASSAVDVVNNGVEMLTGNEYTAQHRAAMAIAASVYLVVTYPELIKNTIAIFKRESHWSTSDENKEMIPFGIALSIAGMLNSGTTLVTQEFDDMILNVSLVVALGLGTVSRFNKEPIEEYE